MDCEGRNLVFIIGIILSIGGLILSRILLHAAEKKFQEAHAARQKCEGKGP